MFYGFTRYALLAKRAVKMAGYWPRSFSRCVSQYNAVKNVTRPIFSYLDRTSLVDKGFIIWPKEEFFLRDQCGKSRAGKIGPSFPLQWLCSAG